MRCAGPRKSLDVRTLVDPLEVVSKGRTHCKLKEFTRMFAKGRISKITADQPAAKLPII